MVISDTAKAAVQATARASRIARAAVIVDDIKSILTRWSFLLGSLLVTFLTFVMSNRWAIGQVMWAVHHLPWSAKVQPDDVAERIAQLMLAATFFKQGGMKRIFAFLGDLWKQAKAQDASPTDGVPKP